MPQIRQPAQRIDRHADELLSRPKGDAHVSGRYRRAVEMWRRSMCRAVRAGRADHTEAELFAAGLGPVILLGLNAEVFCHFAQAVRDATGETIYLVGCANGVLGYLPHRAAYAEGGYETQGAWVFYNTFRPEAGGLESLAGEAAELIRGLREPDRA